jgi:WD40 repeat protein
LLTVSREKTTCLWDATTGRRIAQPLPQGDAITAAVFSPDGKTILACLGTKTARQWQLDTGQPLGPPLVHEGDVRDFRFSPDGKILLTLEHSAGGVRLWEAGTGRRLALLQTDPGIHVNEAAFSPDGKVVQMLTRGAGDLSSHYSVVQLWDVATGKRIGFSLPQIVRQSAFHPASRLVATGEAQAVRLRDVATGKPLGPPLYHRSAVDFVAFSPDGRLLLTLGVDRTVRLWPVAAPLEGTPERVKLRVEVLTGQELDEAGSARLLNERSLELRRALLAREGG